MSPLPPLRPATAADAAAIQAVLETDPGTFALLEGAPLREDEALELLQERPPEVPPERKHVFVADGAAVIDLLEGFPEPATWYLGLIFVAPHLRGQGEGTRLMRWLMAHVQERGGRALRLGVVASNVGARRLYDRLGFTHLARRTRSSRTGAAQEVDVLELALPR